MEQLILALMFCCMCVSSSFTDVRDAFLNSECDFYSRRCEEERRDFDYAKVNANMDHMRDGFPRSNAGFRRTEDAAKRAISTCSRACRACGNRGRACSIYNGLCQQEYGHLCRGFGHNL
jgi:hypothetical protein